MSTVQERLAAFVLQVKEELGNPGYRELARRSGKTISHSTIQAIAKGKQKDIEVDTLLGLSKAVGKSPDEIWIIARGTKKVPVGYQESRFVELYELYQQLTEKTKKQLVDPLIDMVFRETLKHLAEQNADGPARVEAIRKTK